MSRAASVGGDERIRLFCALRLPREAVDGLVAWQRRAFEGVPGVRVVARENLHVTLAFLGHRPQSDLPGVMDALRDAASGVEPPRFGVRGYRETRSVGMLTLDDEECRAQVLAHDFHARLESLGVYEPERRQWLPHVTVLRFRERPRLQLELPALAAFVPSDAAAYLSRLRPGGAQYEVLESVALGGR